MGTTYIYKITVDDGGAPCLKDGMLSLAICKPAIRRAAIDGSVVMGFAANRIVSSWLPRESYARDQLIYMARVYPMDARNYYPKHRSRPDCVYEWDDGRFKPRTKAQFHGTKADMERDVGKQTTGYKNARVLSSKDFRYFGNRGPIANRDSYPCLNRLLGRLNQGARRNFSPELLQEIERFQKAAWQRKSAFSEIEVVPGSGRHACDEGDDFAECDCG